MTYGNLTFSIRVNYNLCLEEACRECGYNRKNGNLTSEHFPPTRKGIKTVSLHLVHLGREITSKEEILEELDKQNLRPGTVEELLALGIAHPNLQREFPIVALGSTWDGPYNCRNVPALFGSDTRRDIIMLWIDRIWEEDIRFLAVPK